MRITIRKLLFLVVLTTCQVQAQPQDPSLSEAANQAASTLTPAQQQQLKKAASTQQPSALKKVTAEMTPEQVQTLQTLADHITPDQVLTPEQMQIFDELDRTTSPSRELLERAIHSVTEKQWGLIHKFFPGLQMTPELSNKIIDLVQQVYRIAYNDKLPVLERGQQIKALASQYVDLDKATIKRTICIWDPIGRSGPIFQAALDQRSQASSFGVDLDMVPYTDEGIVVADLKAGRCDAALISGMRARSFNTFTGTTDAIGAITSPQEMHTLLYAMSRPALAKYMVQGPFDILGIGQGGAAYIFVDDKRINTLGKAAGKKVAVLNYDPMQAQMVAAIGATPVPTTMVSAPNMFNNHVVDVLAAPLVAYQALELYKGMTPDGGIVNYPLAQITMQLIGWRYKIPNVIGQLTREMFYQNYDRIQQALDNETRNVPAHWWINIPDKDKLEYQTMMQQARLTLKAKGYYSGTMLTIERKIRCKFDPSNSECSNPVE